MDAIFEGRLSESPYIDKVWRGCVLRDYAPVCPADARWNLLFMKHGSKIKISAEGATTQHVPKTNREGREFLVIKFQLGVFMPNLPPNTLVNSDAFLPAAGSKSFWINGFAWQLPDFDNVEIFVDRMVREGLLVYDPVVKDVLQDQSPFVSSRTVRRRFLQSTGISPKTVEQIERANEAAVLLGQGVPILDAVYQLGYSDQPHLTRSLRRFYGQTPAQISQTSQPG